MAERSIENMSAQDYRNLEAAPLSSDGASAGAGLPIVPSGESLEPNTLAEQINSSGGQTQGGDADLNLDDLDGDSPREGFTEILESDLGENFTDGGASDAIHSPEMSDMNNPGEIDIEDLDEDAVRELLPPDARLDPIEE